MNDQLKTLFTVYFLSEHKMVELAMPDLSISYYLRNSLPIQNLTKSHIYVFLFGCESKISTEKNPPKTPYLVLQILTHLSIPNLGLELSHVEASLFMNFYFIHCAIMTTENLFI